MKGATLDLHAASLTDAGQARDQNEDACFSGTHVFAVADGLGGHLAGEVASTIALEPIAALDRVEPKRAAAQMGEAVRRANRTVFDRSQSDADLKGMATTMTALAINGGTAALAHVGDSRCYLIRGGRITQISTDHTLVQKMVSEGRLTDEQAEIHPQRSVVTRALGADRDVDVEETTFDVAPGDLLMLCSDGLTSVVADDEILSIVSEESLPEEICRALVDEANARGGPDNITVVAVAIGGEGAPLPPPRAAKETRRFSARLLTWVLVVLLGIVGGAIGVRVWASSSWYVGIDGDHVAIYHGLPVSFAGVHLSEVEEPTGIAATRLPPGMRSSLADGIRARNLTDARRIVSERIEPNAQPLPSPTPSVKPTASARPTAKATT